MHTVKQHSINNQQATGGGVTRRITYTNLAKTALDELVSLNYPNPVKPGMHGLRHDNKPLPTKGPFGSKDCRRNCGGSKFYKKNPMVVV
jgi:hypothetical protein